MTKQVCFLGLFGQDIRADVDKLIRDVLTDTNREGEIETTLKHVESLQLLVSALVQILVDKGIMGADDLNNLIKPISPISYSEILKVVEKEEEEK